MLWNVFVTINVHVQLKPVANDAAVPRTFEGKISPNMSQGIGPNPIENPNTYMTKQASGNQP